MTCCMRVCLTDWVLVQHEHDRNVKIHDVPSQWKVHLL